MSAYIKAEQIIKNFQVGSQLVKVIKGVDLKVTKGDFKIIFGPSGSGKSTLLHTLIGLEPPTKGEVFIDSIPLYQNKNEDDRSIMRKKLIGTIFQRPYWVQSFSVLENVAFPALILGVERQEAYAKAEELLKMVRLEDKATYHTSELSSGEQEKVALARSMINNPKILIADEPTGNLDRKSGEEFMQLLAGLNRKSRVTILMVTHDLEYMPYATTSLKIEDGSIVETFDSTQHQKIKYEEIDL